MVTLKKMKRALIKKARTRFKKIYPCSWNRKLMECFTVLDQDLIFWFNTEDDSTHVLKMKIKGENK